MSAINGVMLDRDAVMELAADRDLSEELRLLLIVAERATPDGVADFEEGELAELLNLPAGGGRSQSRSTRTGKALGKLTYLGYLTSRSSRRRVVLNVERVRSHGIPRHGERYGELTLIREVRTGAWSCRCDCGLVLVFDERHLTAGIATGCADRSRHRLAVAA